MSSGVRRWVLPTGKVAELRARLLAQPGFSRPRKTIKSPESYVFQLYGAYAYPTCGGKPINPYMTSRNLKRAEWRPDGFGLMLVISRGRAFDYLAWYHAVTAAEVVSAVPDREKLR